MPTYYNTLLQKVEDALAIRVATQTVLTAITGAPHKGVSVDSLTLPAVIVRAESAVPMPSRSGNWRVAAVAEVWTGGDDVTVANHRLYVAYLADVLMTSTIATDLTADLADFTVFGVLGGDIKTSVENRRWMWSYGMIIDCKPSD